MFVFFQGIVDMLWLKIPLICVNWGYTSVVSVNKSPTYLNANLGLTVCLSQSTLRHPAMSLRWMTQCRRNVSLPFGFSCGCFSSCSCFKFGRRLSISCRWLITVDVQEVLIMTHQAIALSPKLCLLVVIWGERFVDVELTTTDQKALTLVGPVMWCVYWPTIALILSCLLATWLTFCIKKED